MRKSVLQIVALSLVAALFFELFASQQNHTIAFYQDWYSLKVINARFFPGLSGAENFINERQAIAGNRLNLSKWFGHNQLLYKEELKDLSELNIDFKLRASKSYLLVYFACNEKTCLAYRAGGGSHYPSGFFEIDLDGKFHEVQFNENMSEGSSEVNKQHTLKVTSNGNLYQVSVDKDEPSGYSFQATTNPLILSSGLNDVEVQHINAQMRGEKEFDIGFRAGFDFLRFLAIFGIVAWLLALIHYFLRHTKHSEISAQAAVFTALAAAALFAVDFFYLNRLYFEAVPAGAPYVSPHSNFVGYEQFRRNFFRSQIFQKKYVKFLESPIWFKPAQLANGRSIPEVHMDDLQLISDQGKIEFGTDFETLRRRSSNSLKALKIGFIGGSQAWGIGAANDVNSWPSLVTQQIGRESHRKVWGFNFARCRVGIEYFETQMNNIKSFAPDLFIMDFGANDVASENSAYEKSLETTFKFLNENHISTLVAIEAVNSDALPEDTLPAESERAQSIRQLAEKYSIPVVSLQENFAQEGVASQGLLWHDPIHFTNLGHRLAADFFLKAKPIRDLIKK